MRKFLMVLILTVLTAVSYAVDTVNKKEDKSFVGMVSVGRQVDEHATAIDIQGELGYDIVGTTSGAVTITGVFGVDVNTDFDEIGEHELGINMRMGDALYLLIGVSSIYDGDINHLGYTYRGGVGYVLESGPYVEYTYNKMRNEKFKSTGSDGYNSVSIGYRM